MRYKDFDIVFPPRGLTPEHAVRVKAGTLGVVVGSGSEQSRRIYRVHFPAHGVAYGVGEGQLKPLTHREFNSSLALGFIVGSFISGPLGLVLGVLIAGG